METVKTVLAVIILTSFIVFAVLPALLDSSGHSYKEAVLAGVALIVVAGGFLAVVSSFLWAVDYLF